MTRQPASLGPRERLLRTLRGETADRAPLILEGFHFADRDEINRLPSPGRREIAHRIFEQTHCEWTCPTFVNRYLVTPPQFIREVAREERPGRTTVTAEIDTPKGTLTAVTESNETTETTWTVKCPVEPPPDGDITFAEAKALAAGRITVGGNVEARILENEDVEAVEQATRNAFEGGTGRMVLRKEKMGSAKAVSWQVGRLESAA